MSLTVPDAAKSALITIDVQGDFTLPGAPAEIPGTAAAVPNMVRLIDAFRAANRPIVHMIRLYKADGSNVDLCRREKVLQGWPLPVQERLQRNWLRSSTRVRCRRPRCCGATRNKCGIVSGSCINHGGERSIKPRFPRCSNNSM